jgi:molybdate transport system substrate-binding protein
MRRPITMTDKPDRQRWPNCHCRGGIYAIVRRAACGVALALLGHGLVMAAEITVLSAAAAQAPLTELAGRFEKSTGHHVHLEFSTAGGIENKVRGGAHMDLMIAPIERLGVWANEGIVAPDGARPLGIVRMGIAVRKGGAVPDISSVASFRSSLLSAKSIAYGDPAKGATTGVHFARILKKLGIYDEVRDKSVLAANGIEVMHLVAAGKAEVGITQISEILHVDPAALVGPLPAEVQLASTYAVAASTAEPNTAAALFVDLLVSEEGRARFRHAGFE